MRGAPRLQHPEAAGFEDEVAAARVEVAPAVHQIPDVDDMSPRARLLVRQPRDTLPVDEALEAERAVALAPVT